MTLNGLFQHANEAHFRRPKVLTFRPKPASQQPLQMIILHSLQRCIGGTQAKRAQEGQSLSRDNLTYNVLPPHLSTSPLGSSRIAALLEQGIDLLQHFDPQIDQSTPEFLCREDPGHRKCLLSLGALFPSSNVFF